MQHYCLDIYGANRKILADFKKNYNFVTSLLQKFGLDPLYRPHFFPYYNGVEVKDDGISIFSFLKPIGHITIHNFEKRGSAFVDVFTNKKLNKTALLHFFADFFQTEDILLNKKLKNPQKYLFGPHFTGVGEERLDFEKIYKFLSTAPSKMNMTAISPILMNENESYIWGIVLIAESHISLYYSKKDNKFYVDCFSCVLGHEKETEEFLKEFFKNLTLSLNFRGGKFKL